MKERIRTRIKELKKEQILVFVLILGLLIVVLLPTKKTKVTKPVEEAGTPVQEAEIQEETIQKQLERQLVETLQQVEGVGAVTAAITLETTGRKIVEKDTPANDSMTSQEDSQGGKQDSKNSSSEEATVYQKDGEGNQTPYVVSETTPEIRGVVVVAQGGNDPVIVQQIQEAVMALFHVDAHKIKVMKMK
ncbi:hypothetical protein [Ruminococcus gauvreauii]|uniref:hypothetical protein n=1 Tax=Ruminococcus gauvreauii TaxID=438033 RepID=UPI0039845596